MVFIILTQLNEPTFILLAFQNASNKSTLLKYFNSVSDVDVNISDKSFKCNGNEKSEIVFEQIFFSSIPNFNKSSFTCFSGKTFESTILIKSLFSFRKLLNLLSLSKSKLLQATTTFIFEYALAALRILFIICHLLIFLPETVLNASNWSITINALRPCEILTKIFSGDSFLL